ncbi:LysE family translocator [Azospirillum sp. RWY-5-1]|uniref:LysE family translocator n=1 Tax=Azospirillum oleiclasticum TaxID=2735135 RepID=A0ABX2T5V2_9PROT|nr:LysE family translocator [Azospirillum oleiclasticum]NYZ11367.1 LysE family translocator [Azospirillum oleiclasticum]NYZ18528.1 LysE family translocator [Azospirillum oleiclasticum]
MILDPQLLSLYLVAAVVLVLAPGPDSLLVLSRGINDGRRAGLVAALGITAGSLLHAVMAAVGVSAMIAASPRLFDTLRWAGGAYLAWIGVKALKAAWDARRAGAGGLMPTESANDRRVFAQALLTNLLNPKVILFQLAFVPQFVAPALGHVALQIVLLGAIHAVLGGIYLSGIAAAASGAARRALSSQTMRVVLDAVAGALFLGFALRLLLTQRSTA